MKTTDDFLLEARVLCESYYAYKGQSVAEVIRRWQEEGDKLFDPPKQIRHKKHAMYAHGLVPVKELWPHREYTWTRSKARRSPEEWDKLAAQMDAEGVQDPLHLMIGRRGGVKIGEGNHRLAIARELGMKTLPVVFHFRESA